MCNLGIFLVIYDPEFSKVVEYNSGTFERGFFTQDDALRTLKLGECGEV